MEKDDLIKAIASRDIRVFNRVWSSFQVNRSERDIQDLLADMVYEYYSENDFQFFKRVLQKVFDSSKISLDFNVDYWTPTFLCIAVDAGSRKLFDLLIVNGASLNFTGNPNFRHDPLNREMLRSHNGVTCLDFAFQKRNTLIGSVIKDCQLHSVKLPIDSAEKTITISRSDFDTLIDRSEVLKNIVALDNLISHILLLGGKTFNEVFSCGK